ncbi:MAG: glycine zipper domain-containing protein [Myxococcota bacterium]
MAGRKNDSTSTSREAARLSANRAFDGLRREAANRGHENATVGAGLGAAFGAMAGSFLGPVGTVVGGAVGAGIGRSIGSDLDRGGRS